MYNLPYLQDGGRLPYLQEGLPVIPVDQNDDEDPSQVIAEFERERQQVQEADDANKTAAADHMGVYTGDPTAPTAPPADYSVANQGTPHRLNLVTDTRLPPRQDTPSSAPDATSPAPGSSIADYQPGGKLYKQSESSLFTPPPSGFDRLYQMSIPGARDANGNVIGPPVMSKPKWWQTALAAGLGAGAGWSNAAGRTRTPIDIGAATEGILHPGYQGRLEEWQSRVAPVEKQAQIEAERATMQQKASLNQANISLKAGQTQAAIDHGAYWRHRAATEANRYTSATSGPNKGRIFDRVTGEWKVGLPTIQDLKEQGLAIGMSAQDAINYAASVASGGKYTQTKPEKTAVETAAAAANEAQQAEAKMAASGEMPSGGFTTTGVAFAAIDKSKALTSQEKANLKAWLNVRPNPTATGTNTSLRIEGLAQTREYPVVDTKNGNTLMMLSASDLNAANHAEPGRYAPAGPAAKASTSAAVFQDLHYNINTARNAIAALDSMDAGTRAGLAYALRHTDPASAFQSFVTGTVGSVMNPQQQEAAQSLALLAENAMTLRSVAGMGQGSDDLRAAILATLPSAKSPSKGYALGQLNKFEQVVNRLETGPLKLGNPQQRQQTSPAAAGPGRGGQSDVQLPPQAAAELKEGHDTTFSNGQVWRLQHGRPVRIK